ncbi:DUF2263 domain-containing protein [Mycena sanguinolenta]|uniref:DUF2263 domain-containing protein n=1 Tax=Mycena sanguinolenta TaxID=230812 RepID=A0A8H6XHX5_9AGAR|nr:DUF2263 domain-containing protein [Mycena sanguinolenta]
MSSRTLNAEPPAFVRRPREELVEIAHDTLAAVKRGSYTIDSSTETHNLPDLSAANNSTIYFDPDALQDWQTTVAPKRSISTDFVIYQATTLEGIRSCLGASNSASDPHAFLFSILPPVLLPAADSSVARAHKKKPLHARPTSTHPSPAPLLFHSTPPTGLAKTPRSSHAMILTQNVRFVRDDAGAWVAPADVDVLTSAAVNVNALRRSLRIPEEGPLPTDIGADVSNLMRERMARILCAMARSGAEEVILGSFGTGAFRNNVEFVAQTWADLLCGEQAPFRDVFRKVVFAIVDRGTWGMFCEVFRRAGATFEEVVKDE